VYCALYFYPQVVRTRRKCSTCTRFGNAARVLAAWISFVTFANKQNSTCCMNTLCLLYPQRTQHNKQGIQYQYRAHEPNGKLTKHTADQLRSPLLHKPH
jgi:hypothetical protein